MSIVVFMYHALYRTAEDRAQIDPADRPYALHVDRFAEQLDWLESAGIPVIDPRGVAHADATSGVLLTFDDGHGSNRRYAFPELARRGRRALFFVTTDFIGHRPGFCDWAELREMVQSGMALGSHGKTHRFLADLDDADARAELVVSRRTIEESIGAPVEALSFPGGRYRPQHLALARQAGYRRCFGSQPGVWESDALARAPVPRVPIRASMTLPLFQRYARAERGLMACARASDTAKRWAKRMIGNRLYHAIYERLA